MFCKNCGAQIADGAKFCGVCGASQAKTAAPVAPAAPAAPTNPNSASASAAAAINLGSRADVIKVYTKCILLGIIVFAMVLSFMNLFNTYDVKFTGSQGGTKESITIPVKQLFKKEFDNKFTVHLISNILMGVANLGIVAVGVLCFLKDKNNNDLYDQFIGKAIKLNPLLLVGVVGAGASVVQVLCYLIFKANMDAKYSASVHWMTWVALVLYAGCAILDLLVLNSKKK